MDMQVPDTTMPETDPADMARVPNRRDAPRERQSEACGGPITLRQYERFQCMREAPAKNRVSVLLPTGN